MVLCILFSFRLIYIPGCLCLCIFLNFLIQSSTQHPPSMFSTHSTYYIVINPPLWACMCCCRLPPLKYTRSRPSFPLPSLFRELWTHIQARYHYSYSWLTDKEVFSCLNSDCGKSIIYTIQLICLYGVWHKTYMKATDIVLGNDCKDSQPSCVKCRIECVNNPDSEGHPCQEG